MLATLTVGVFAMSTAPVTPTVHPGASETVGVPSTFTPQGAAPCSATTVLPGARLTSPVTLTSQAPLCCAATVGVPLMPTFHGPLCVALTAPATVVVPVAFVGTASASVFDTLTD